MPENWGCAENVRDKTSVKKDIFNADHFVFYPMSKLPIHVPDLKLDIKNF